MGEIDRPKESFVHKSDKERRKGLAGLFFLLLGRRGPVALLAVCAIAVFLLGAPFGWSLSRFASFAEGKPGLKWLAGAARAADRTLFRGDGSAEGGLAAGGPGSLSSGDFSASSYRRQSADMARGSADPGSMVEGGAALLKEDEAPARASAASAAAVDSKIRAINPAEASAKVASAVEVPSRMAGQLAMAETGGASAFGGPGLFSGAMGAVSREDGLLSGSGAFKDLSPTAKTIDAKKFRGRVTKFASGAVRSSLSGGRSMLAYGNKYRYRLALAFTQADYAETSGAIEPAAVYGRAWSTGEMAEKVLGLPGEATPTGAPGVPNIAPIYRMQDVQQCIGQIQSVSDNLGATNAQMQALIECVEKGCNGQGSLTQAISDNGNWFSQQGSPPNCCDGGAVDNWNGHVAAIDSAIDQFNEKQAQIQALCQQSLGYQSQITAACGNSVPTSTQKDMADAASGCQSFTAIGQNQKPHTVDHCSDAKCCIDSMFSVAGILVSVFATVMTGGALGGILLTLGLVIGYGMKQASHTSIWQTLGGDGGQDVHDVRGDLPTQNQLTPHNSGGSGSSTSGPTTP